MESVCWSETLLVHSGMPKTDTTSCYRLVIFALPHNNNDIFLQLRARHWPRQKHPHLIMQPSSRRPHYALHPVRLSICLSRALR